MAGRRAGAGLALAAVALSAAGCGSTTTVTTTVTRTVTTTRTVTQAAESACTGSQLSGTFALVPGSAGAGQVQYELELTNTSSTRCTVFGLPQVYLLAANGSSLPTHVTANLSGDATAARVAVVPGDSAHAEARFSPSVPGEGDSTSGACQPKAATLAVTPPGGGTVKAPIQPATSVCEQGTLNFSYYGR